MHLLNGLILSPSTQSLRATVSRLFSRSLGILSLTYLVALVTLLSSPSVVVAQGEPADKQNDTTASTTLNDESTRNGQSDVSLAPSSNASPMADTQSDAESTPVRAVIRVSWDMIDRLADDHIDAAVPFRSPVMGGWMSGHVRSGADVTIRMQERSDEARFSIVAEGTAQGWYHASRDDVRLSGPLSIPFRATKTVTFDGEQFAATRPAVRANVQIGFSSISSTKRGLFSRLRDRLVRRAVVQEKPNLERAAQPLAEQYLTSFVEEEMVGVVAELNRVSDIDSTILAAYPQLKDWKVQLSSTPDYLEARYMPPGSSQVALPEDPRRPQNAGLEIWLRTTEAEARLLEQVGNWDQSQQALKSYFQQHEVTVKEMATEAKIVSIGDWVVVAIGKAIHDDEMVSIGAE